MNLAEIWRRLTTTRRARILETELARERAANAEQGIEVARQGAEIIRLRAESRALLNSILGIAGVPPVSASLDDLAATQSQNATPPSVARTTNHSRPARIQPRTSPRQRAAVPGRKSTACSNSNPRKKKSQQRIRYRRPVSSIAH
jgi:hypothetical protein